MSGPKVVRVRTREELAAECHALIDALRAAIDDCEGFARGHDFTDSASVQRHKAFVEELNQKVEAGEFETVRRMCHAEIARVRSEREHVEDEVLRRAAECASRRRRCQYMAASLAKKLQAAGKPVPREIETARLGRIGKSDEELKSVEVVVSRVLADQTLESAQENGTRMTEEQRRLAAFLSVNEPRPTMPADANAPFSSALKRFDRAMAEVRTLDATAIGNQLLARMQAVLDEPDTPQASMRIDSLILEWTQRRKTLREIADKQLRAKQLALELGRLSDEQAQVLIARLAHAADSDLDAEIAQVHAHVEQTTRKMAATQRRKAVLKGLATLGYEVGSELSTAWSEGGRVIVTKPDRPGYGIELAGPPDANQMQVKVVAFATAGVEKDAARDRDAETLWCSEFGKLQRLLNSAGTTMNVVRALGIGAVPVTYVERPTSQEHEHERDTAGQLHGRTHR